MWEQRIWENKFNKLVKILNLPYNRIFNVFDNEDGLQSDLS